MSDEIPVTAVEIYECGICSHYHRADWNGDCRDDDARFNIEDVIAAYGIEGIGWIEINMSGTKDEDYYGDDEIEEDGWEEY